MPLKTLIARLIQPALNDIPPLNYEDVFKGTSGHPESNGAFATERQQVSQHFAEKDADSYFKEVFSGPLL